jgi:D-glycero-alpha-D-manno-heptose-7-phosphate kinase
VIITRTPVRISFLGGGTDYPDHFCSHGGQTLSATIDKYSYVTVNRMADIFDYNFRVAYSKLELVHEAAEIVHPAVRECLRFLGLERGVEINYVGDLPARSGLGSSSSFTVGLLHALHTLKGEMVSRTQLAEEAVHVEQKMIGERVGCQDQYACAHGGVLHLQFAGDGVRVSPVPLSAERMDQLQRHLMLMYTGIQRNAHEVLEEQIAKTKQGSLKTDLDKLSALVNDGLAVLTGNGPVSEFGELLHSAWVTKRTLSSRTSNAAIDQHYESARKAGAVGGKLLGAGGGGFLLLVAEPSMQEQIERALPDLRRVPFTFERSGSTLLFYNG